MSAFATVFSLHSSWSTGVNQMRKVKVKMFKGTLFQVEESVNAFLGEVDQRGFEKYCLEFSTSAIDGETVVQAIFYTEE
jgi:hypothetical protein